MSITGLSLSLFATGRAPDWISKELLRVITLVLAMGRALDWVIKEPSLWFLRLDGGHSFIVER